MDVHFRDTIMVDQDNRLWLWSDKTVSTFALRVANAYWSDRSGPKTVICKTQEPDSFKALFATWDDFVDEIDENELIAVAFVLNPILESLKYQKVKLNIQPFILYTIVYFLLKQHLSFPTTYIQRFS